MRLTPLLPILAVVTSVLAVPPALAEGDGPLPLWHAGIEQGYQQLAEATADLETSARRYCQTPSDSARSRLDDQWRTAFDAWQAVRFVDFGPVEQNTLGWQFQFWPDPKNLVARKAGYYLGMEEPVSAADVDEAGVAVQGFPMVEYLLFDSRIKEGDRGLPSDQACSLLTAVSAHLAENAEGLSSAWTTLERPYRTNEQYRGATVESGMAALSLLEERRLGGPMGLRGGGKRSVYGADAWRSGHSLAAIRASLQGLYDFYLPGLESALRQAGNPTLASRIRSQFEETLARFDNLPDAMAPLLSDERFGELQGLYADLSQLATLVNDQAGTALDVVRGFNSSDGD
ncbi:imelysin family protein [Marinobacter lacisalsi]|uniref:Imelysin family protein n=1 Tax=Marinobacter lacisalsi TaxID=475979 RepID=A0ABV8QC29_9GAMM